MKKLSILAILVIVAVVALTSFTGNPSDKVAEGQTGVLKVSQSQF